MTSAVNALEPRQMDMAASPLDGIEHRTWHVGWPAYLRPIFLAACGLVITVVMGQLWWPAALLLGTASGALFVFNILSLRSTRLFTNAQGVWAFAGVFPWSKGTAGVKWRDLDEVTFQTGFLPWLTGAYHVQVSHRYTKSAELEVLYVRYGQSAAVHINRLHQRYIVANADPVS